MRNFIDANTILTVTLPYDRPLDILLLGTRVPLCPTGVECLATTTFGGQRRPNKGSSAFRLVLGRADLSFLRLC